MKATTRHYVAAGVDIIHTLSELTESINDLAGVPGLSQAAKLVQGILNVCNEVSVNK
jgi:hypothetical protein